MRCLYFHFCCYLLFQVLVYVLSRQIVTSLFAAMIVSGGMIVAMGR